MKIEIPNKLIYAALAIMAMIAIDSHISKIRDFKNKERIFNTRIQIGDETGIVVGLLGQPSYYDKDFLWWEQGTGQQGPPTKPVILMIYRGYPRRRADLTLIFDRNTYRLIEKSRATVYSVTHY